VSFQVEKLARKGSQSLAKPVSIGATCQNEKSALSYQRGTETILLVDDEEALRTVVVDLLSQLGYHMLSAASGEQAIKVAAEYSGKIDLLLTDVAMDELPGPELAEKLLQTRPGMKVIFISGFADGSFAWEGILRPGMVLVQKPFSIKVLSAKLREVLQTPEPV
jgi:two-component system cell cycle sensor histidine kinase/response regulator CckA